ncbi:S-adenosyl-L-methionine-dependent methyltransferase [Astrocystis sublimbata]|nr:S-adenosyl-L-methionine-dependent methyltransferase [Astrocystis sublimbata]
MSPTNRILELSSLIGQQTAIINDFFEEHQLPTPSLEVGALERLPIPDDASDVKAAKAAVIEACSELKALLTGPRELLGFNWTSYASVKAILRFRLDLSFPVGEATSFDAMAKFSGLNAKIVRRLVRHAIFNHLFFREEKPGVVTHSALTAILARDEITRNSLTLKLDEFWPAAVKMTDAMETWLNSEDVNETGFSLAHSSGKGMYDTFRNDPARVSRFGLHFTKPDQSFDGLLENYPWAEKKTMVDVGGSWGNVAIEIAKKFPHMRCFVQDLPDVVAEGALRLPADLQERVEYVPHDCFSPQPIAADVYYFRSIFHNWADKYCIRILQALIPALQPGARVLIHEHIIPALEDLTEIEARKAINMDIGMHMLFNSQEREQDEWAELFRRADPRFRYVGARRPEGARRWMIEAEWKG